MKSVLAAVAASALGLAAISGCTIEEDVEAGVAQEFGSDYFGAGGVLNVIDPIDGDAFLAGGNVSIASEIDGDLIAAGGDVSVGGSIGDDVYAAGGNVSVDAIVSGNARIAGGDVTVGPATAIAGSVSLTGGRVEFEGGAQGSLRAAGANVRLNGTIEGDVKVHSEDLTIGPETRIAGTLIYRGPEAPQVPEGAVIAGGVDYRESSSRHYFDRAGNTVRDTAHVAGSITWFVGSFLAAAVFALAFPQATARATDVLRREPLKAIALGFAILVCVPLAGVLLVVTIIGIPLALLLVPLYLLLMFLGWVTTALFLGRRGLETVRGAQPATRGWTLGALLAALVVLWLLRRVPLIGGWIAFIALVAGIGALVWQAWSRREAALRATV
jgi:cytoskeletal protein CcmA (bactofilin family)